MYMYIDVQVSAHLYWDNHSRVSQTVDLITIRFKVKFFVEKLLYLLAL